MHQIGRQQSVERRRRTCAQNIARQWINLNIRVGSASQSIISFPSYLLCRPNPVLFCAVCPSYVNTVHVNKIRDKSHKAANISAFVSRYEKSNANNSVHAPIQWIYVSPFRCLFSIRFNLFAFVDHSILSQYKQEEFWINTCIFSLSFSESRWVTRNESFLIFPLYPQSTHYHEMLGNHTDWARWWVEFHCEIVNDVNGTIRYLLFLLFVSVCADLAAGRMRLRVSFSAPCVITDHF